MRRENLCAAGSRATIESYGKFKAMLDALLLAQCRLISGGIRARTIEERTRWRRLIRPGANPARLIVVTIGRLNVDWALFRRIGEL